MPMGRASVARLPGLAHVYPKRVNPIYTHRALEFRALQVPEAAQEK